MSDNRTLAKGAMIGGVPVYNNVESTQDTTMPNTSFFKTEDVDGKPVKIPRDNMMGIVKECLGTILNGGSDQTTVAKIPTLNGNTLGASTAATLSSVLGGTKIYSSDTVPAINQVPTDRITTFTVTPSSPNRTDRKWLEYAQITYIPTGYFVTELMTTVTGGEPVAYARTLEQHNGVIDSGLSRDFVRLDNFGCSTPSALSSLLGVGQARMEEKTINANQSVIISNTAYSLLFIVGKDDNISYLVATAYRNVKVLDSSATEGILSFVESESSLTITNNKAASVKLKIYKLILG